MAKSTLALDNALDLNQVLTTGSTLQINQDYSEEVQNDEYEKPQGKPIDFIGQPVKCFEDLQKDMTAVDNAGLVKKKIIEEGGGFPIDKKCTVHIAYSGYWEKELDPFDVRKSDKPLIVDLNESGLLAGLQIAVESMLVGETSVFLMSYKVLYGELGIPPRIKPKADGVFYIKLIRSTITPEKGKLDLSEPNIFQRVYHEVKLLYASGLTLYKSNNLPAVIQMFRKAVYMLHKCRLANEQEEMQQEKMLKKLYINLAVCYNVSKQPLKACIACNELNRLKCLWNNGKALLQNAKALRMIGEFKGAEKRLKKAKALCPDSKEIDAEFELLNKMQESCNQTKLIVEKVVGPSIELISDDFKQAVDNLIKNFKENDDLCKLVLPAGLNCEETAYIKQVCVRENVFFNKINKDFALDKEESITSEVRSTDSLDNFMIDEIFT